MEAYIPSDDHATQLVDDEHVELWGRLAELLLKDLQDGLHHSWGVPQSYSDVPQSPDGVVWNEVGIPR